jgi:tetratricopeptide (TPR) repeat protein
MKLPVTTWSRLAVALCLVVLGTGPAWADKWQKEKGDCEETFEQWRTESLERLRDCTMRWEMYRDITKVDDNQRTIVQEAFEKLYSEGTERDAVMALSALKRLGLRPAKLREKSVAVPKAAPAPELAPVIQAPEEKRVGKSLKTARAEVEAEAEAEAMSEATPVEAARAPSRKEARLHVQRGNSHFKSGQTMEALTAYLEACDADPTYAPPLYLTAMTYARLGKKDMAIDYLRSLKALNSDEARPLVRRAAQDPEFKALRGVATFKDLTGTAVVQILSAGGDAAKAKVDAHVKRLTEIGQPVANIGIDRNPRHNTYVYTKAGYEDQGEDLRRQLKLGMVHKRPIHWPSEYDIIIVVGSPEVAKFEDDEAEKNGQKKAEMNKAAEAAKKKQEDKERAEREKLKRRMMMLQAMEDMEQPAAPDAPQNASEIPTDAPEAPALPE